MKVTYSDVQIRRQIYLAWINAIFAVGLIGLGLHFVYAGNTTIGLIDLGIGALNLVSMQMSRRRAAVMRQINQVDIETYKVIERFRQQQGRDL